MVRGVHIRRAGSERTTVETALRCYVVEVTPSKRPITQVSELRWAEVLLKHLGRYFNPGWLRIKREYGMSELHFHDLRNEAVSRLVEAGFSDQEAFAISGHKSMQMLKRYAHLWAEDLVSKWDDAELRRAASLCPDSDISRRSWA